MPYRKNKTVMMNSEYPKSNQFCVNAQVTNKMEVRPKAYQIKI
jgi:hypothetical protein